MRPDKPPKNTQRITRWRDLPSLSTPATYEVQSPDGDSRKVFLKAGNRRVLEGLRKGPLYCASPVRLSDRVLILKRDYGLNIRTEIYDTDRATDSERFGVYFLDDRVSAIMESPVVDSPVVECET